MTLRVDIYTHNQFKLRNLLFILINCVENLVTHALELLINLICIQFHTELLGHIKCFCLFRNRIYKIGDILLEILIIFQFLTQSLRCLDQSLTVNGYLETGTLLIYTADFQLHAFLVYIVNTADDDIKILCQKSLCLFFIGKYLHDFLNGIQILCHLLHALQSILVICHNILKADTQI